MPSMVTTVTSTDGTPIAFERSGHGPALALVHGTTADRTRWATLISALISHRTVYAMDRRGRGDSGDADTYSIEREFEDVSAVVEAAGDSVDLLGHSFGALCAMEAAVRTGRVRKLILYEPYFPVEGVGPLYAEGERERFQALIDGGDRELLLSTFMKDLVGLTDAELETMRAEPSWQGRLAAAHTLVREMDEAEYRFDPERFRSLRSNCLLLVGEKSPPVMKAPSQLLASTLPDSRTVILPGQGHGAISMAPELFAQEVIQFLNE